MIRKISWLICASVLLLSLASQAQKKKKSNAKAPSSSSSGYGGGSGYGGSSGTGGGSGTGGSNSGSGYGGGDSGYGGGSGYGSSNNNQPQPTNQPRANIPYEVVKSTGNAALDSVIPSQRNDASIERTLIKERQPLAFEHIREDDAIYRHKVWREIDIREKMNSAFRYANNEDNGNQRFISILLKAIRNRDITAFDASLDDRFTTPLTPDQVMTAFSGGLDTVPVTDMNGDVVKYRVMTKEVDPDSIYRFKIKEEWVFDKESSRLFVRILGIAPMKRLTRSDGQDLDPNNPEFQPMFWVYYPDCRGFLAKYDAYNGKNYGGRMTWEELFENRMFSSYITKTSMDNPFDRTLKSYIKEPLYRLLEGENIKEKIFNYEQDLWSY
jgi:gliding motility associated protien GldN